MIKFLLLITISFIISLNPKGCQELGNDIIYIGVNDHTLDFWEKQFKIPNGMAYNSYIVLDDKITIFDTVNAGFLSEWLQNIKAVLKGKQPDYLIIHHMEPDHSANVDEFIKLYPKTTVVASKQSFVMMKNYFGKDYSSNRKIVKEGDTLNTGKHTFSFIEAPMVHWPEVIVTYDVTSKELFSSDGFGKFGALDVDEPWDDEARRYFINIVVKYGPQTQALLKKVGKIEVKMICPSHGPILTENLGHYISLYDKWSSYTSEEDGVVIVYTSIYGHTQKAIDLLVDELKKNGVKKIITHDVSIFDISKAVADAFRYSKLILATTTYYTDMFPWMRHFIYKLVESNFQKKTIGFIENGSWAPNAINNMKKMLENCKKLNYLESEVKIFSALNEKSKKEIESLAKEISK